MAVGRIDVDTLFFVGKEVLDVFEMESRMRWNLRLEVFKAYAIL